MKISVVIITYNEERNLQRCLASVSEIADEIVIVDSFSTDRTTEIAAKYKARVVKQSFLGYVDQKNFATWEARHDWVLSLDADEVLSLPLAAAILQLKKPGATVCCYEFARMANYCGNWIRHGGWYPDRKVRLFDRNAGEWQGVNNLHERWVPYQQQRPGRLQGDLLHYTFDSISEHLRQIDRFTDINARNLAAAGKNASLFKIMVSPVWRFINDYILHLGFLDGYSGYLVCRYSAMATQIKYAKLRQYATSRKREYREALLQKQAEVVERCTV